MSKTVAVMLGDGFEPVEVVAPVDAMRRAGLDVTLISVSNDLDVEAAQDITLKADRIVSDVDLMDFDMIMVPGGSGGVENLSKCEPLKTALVNYMKEGKWVASICAGPTILANLGLLEGYSATCYPGAQTNFPEGVYRELCVITDRNLITASGPGFALEFGKAIVEALVGKDKANEVASGMLFDLK